MTGAGLDRDHLFGLAAVAGGLVPLEELVRAVRRHGHTGGTRAALLAAGLLDDHAAARLDATIDALQASTGADGGELPTASEPSLGATMGLQSERGLVPLGGADEHTITEGSPTRYQLHGGSYATAELGRGGIGRVLLAFDGHIGRDVAIKELLPATSTGGTGSPEETAEDVGRFLREACLTGQLEHPTIIPVHEVGRWPDGRLYYTMKVVRGRTLSRALGECSGASERLALLPHYVDLCNAIAYAHSRGVINRDIKPDNVMVGQFGETVVLDWGMAKVIDGHDEASAPEASLGLSGSARVDQTEAGVVFGTPLYMSPEQASGLADQVREEADVWSLGVVLYELLTGTLPYVSRDKIELMARIVGGAPIIPPAALDPTIPPELSAIAMRALSYERRDRYPSAAELAADIEAYEAGKRVGAYEYSSWELVKRFARKNKAIISGLATAVVAIVVALVVVVGFYRDEQAARRTASYHLAQAFYQKAATLLEEKTPLTAAIYAAAALVYDPSHPESPYYHHDFVPDPAPALPLEADAAGLLHLASTQKVAGVTHVIPVGSGSNEAIFSFDGATLLSADRSGDVHLWSPSSGAPLGKLTGHTDKVYALAMAPDGASLASVSKDETLRIWSLASKVCRHVLEGHTDKIVDVAWSGTGVVATASRDGSMRLWDPVSGTQTALFEDHEGAVNSVCFSPSGDLIASGGANGAVMVRSTTTGAVSLVLEGHESDVRGLAISADGGLLASGGYDETVILWDLATGAKLRVLEGHTSRITAVAFSPDGSLLASAGYDERVLLWDVASGSLVAILEGHGDKIPGLDFSPDGSLLASASTDATIRLWSILAQAPTHVMVTSATPLRAMAHDAQSDTWAFGGDDSTVTVLSGAAIEPVVVEGLPGSLLSVAVAPGGGLVATGHEAKEVALVSTEAPYPVQLVGGHTGWVTSLAFSPDGALLASGGVDRAVQLVTIATPTEPRTLGSHGDEVDSLAFSPDGDVLASGSKDMLVKIWDTASGMLSSTLSGHAETVNDLVFHPDGATLYSAGKDGLVYEWSRATWTTTRVFHGHAEEVTALAITSDGAHLASSSVDGVVIVWELATGRRLVRIATGADVFDLAFSSDDVALGVAVGDTLISYPHVPDIIGTPPMDLLTEATAKAGMVLEGFSAIGPIYPGAAP